MACTEISCWLYHWQTLVGALLALIVAVATIVVMNGQRRDEMKRHQQEIERLHEAERRKRLAVRAAMPDALSDLSAYARGCGEWLTGQAEGPPTLPIEAIGTLKTAIEFIDNDAAARSFELVSWYQVFRARMSSEVPAIQAPGFGERAYDLALLHAYINSLFEYARNERDEVPMTPPTRTEMISGLRNGFGMVHVMSHEEAFETTFGFIRHRHPEE